MATMSSLISRVRIELGDIEKAFVTQFVADGTTNRFVLHYSPLDGENLLVFKNGTDISNQASVEESTGILILDTVPADGDEITVSGHYYRYFTNPELTTLITNALTQHVAGKKDSVGRPLTLDNLPVVDEYPLVVYSVTLALYTLATDAAFDIDVQAPDGVTIPRTERYRQLMQMVETRQQQYRELCALLGVGMYSIDVFSLRRVSKATGRYIPQYVPQEVDDRSYPDRIDVPIPNYGDKPAPWPTESGPLTAYQGRTFTTAIDFQGAYSAYSFLANVLNQRGSVVVVQHFGLNVVDHGPISSGSSTHSYTATLTLDKDQTMYLPERTYWSFSIVDNTTKDQTEIEGGTLYTTRVSTVVL
jgi:hypothetical protein